jgi:hypothetical protein
MGKYRAAKVGHDKKEESNMKKRMRTGFLVSLGVVVLLTMFPLAALACHPLEYNGNGGCAGFWLSVKSSDPTTYHWRAQLWQVGVNGAPDSKVDEQSGNLNVTVGNVTVYVPTGANPNDGETWRHWNFTCNGSYYVKLHWDLNGSYTWNKTTDPVSCQTPSAVTLASFNAVPAGGAIALNWETVSESYNLGFNLYRAESANGPRTKLNANLIPSQDGSLGGATYQFVDKAAKPGITYSYWLEDVDVYGAATWHGPVSAALPFLHKVMPSRPRLVPSRSAERNG